MTRAAWTRRVEMRPGELTSTSRQAHASLSPHSLAMEFVAREHLRGTGNTETGDVSSRVSPPQRVGQAELQAKSRVSGARYARPVYRIRDRGTRGFA